MSGTGFEPRLAQLLGRGERDELPRRCGEVNERVDRAGSVQSINATGTLSR